MSKMRRLGGAMCLISAFLAAQQLAPQHERKCALVIGNDRYVYVTPLKTAINDARSVEALLQSSYGFDTRLLLNATRAQIMSALSSYRRELDSSSSLLIYYAGHGFLDTTVDKAYWWPVDARLDDNAEWISADDITTSVKAIPARHVLIVSDSCFSGALTRGVTASQLSSLHSDRDRTLAKLQERASREVFASGGKEPVSDGGDGEHSIFAGAFLRSLGRTENASIAAEEVFQDVRESVAGRSSQVPEFDPIRNSGHDGGSFVFRRLASAAPTVAESPPLRPEAGNLRAPAVDSSGPNDILATLGPKTSTNPPTAPATVAPRESTHQPIPVGGNVQAANLINKVAPAYPPAAKQARVQGTVELSAIIGKDGRVQELKVVRGHPLLIKAALDAAKQWAYRPTLINGEPVEVSTTIDVTFALQ